LFYLIIGTLLEYFYENYRQSLTEKYLYQKLSTTSLQEMDLDHDGKITPKEFLEYMLIHCELANEDDIQKINEKFQELDVDNSGDLDGYDVLD
jgi:hypothetical protein